MATEPLIELIPAAFHILWEAALNDNRLPPANPTVIFDLDFDFNASRGNSFKFQQRTRSFSDSSDSSSSPSPRRPDPTIRLRENPDLLLTRQQNMDLNIEMASLYAKETAAVCIIECERGEKLVKKSFHDIRGGGKFWKCAKTEDYLLNWLNSDLTSQHASTVDVRIYLSCPPQSTTSDGLRLWLENLKEEGKLVTMSIKLASLGTLHPGRHQRRRHHHHNNSIHDNTPRATNKNEESEQEDESLEGLRRLQDDGVSVSPIPPWEWPELLSLLADKMALRRLEKSHRQSTNQLRVLLAGGRSSNHDNSV